MSSYDSTAVTKIDSIDSVSSTHDYTIGPRVFASNAIAIGSNVSASKNYELVIGGLVHDEMRVVMTPEEHSIASRLIARAMSNGR